MYDTRGRRFWDLYQHLVDTLYATIPGERLGLCRPLIAEEFPQLTNPQIERLENHVLRMVAWMCEHDTQEEDGRYL